MATRQIIVVRRCRLGAVVDDTDKRMGIVGVSSDCDGEIHEIEWDRRANKMKKNQMQRRTVKIKIKIKNKNRCATWPYLIGWLKHFAIQCITVYGE